MPCNTNTLYFANNLTYRKNKRPMWIDSFKALNTTKTMVCFDSFP